jgi:hypothetical protein
VNASSSGCDIRVTKITQNHRAGASATRPPRRLNHAHNAHATNGSTSHECVAARCQVRRTTGSSHSASGSTSRSGSVFNAMPASSAARRCARGAMVAAMTPP